MRGLGLPACGSGVTVPISTKPNPRANKEGYMRPSLSNPAASPIGLFTLFPKSFVCRTGKSPRIASSKTGLHQEFLKPSQQKTASFHVLFRHHLKKKEVEVDEKQNQLRNSFSPHASDSKTYSSTSRLCQIPSGKSAL